MTVSVVNRWTGTLSLPIGQLSNTATIALSNINKGVLFWTTQGGSAANPNTDCSYGEITNTTTATFARNSSARDITIVYTVLELSGDVSVQRGAINMASTVENVTLSALTAIDQAWELHNGTLWTGNSSFNQRGGTLPQITSETNLQFTATSADTAATAYWQVLDFSQSSDITTQRGKKLISSGTVPVTTTINPVTLGQSIAYLCGLETNNTGSAPDRRGFNLKFIADNEIQHDKEDPAGDPTSGWVVADCKWGANIESGTTALAVDANVGTAAISSVDLDKSVVISGSCVVGHGTGKTTRGGNDYANWASATLKFNSDTEIELEKFDSGAVQTLQWYVIEWESGVVSPVLTIQDLDHAHDLEAPTISTETQSDLTVQELDHAHELESPTISTEQDLTLTVQELDHGHDLESPTISTETGVALTVQDFDHGHLLDSPFLSLEKSLVIQELLHGHDLESPTIALFDAFGGFARRKLAGTGLNYVQYPNTGNPENFRVDSGVKTLIVEEWHPNVVDGLTKCQVRLFRDSTLIRAVSYDQNVNGGQWNELFNEQDPIAGDYFLRTMDDQQSGIGGTGTYVYADAFQVTIDAAPQLTPQPMVHLHTMSNIGLLSDYELQINNLDHSHQLEAPTISDVKVATAQDLDHEHLLDSPTITTDVQDALVVGDLTHSHDLESPTVNYNFLSTVNDLDHGHDLEQATITGELSLVISDIDHGHDIESPTIATGDVAAAANLVHSQSIDNVALESLSILPAVKELFHDQHQIDNVDLVYNQQLSLVINDMTHNHVIDEATITTDPVLFIDSIDHAHVIDSLELSAASSLQSFDMNHPHTIDTVDAFFEEDLPPLDRTYLVKPENINYIVKLESNTYVVK